MAPRSIGTIFSEITAAAENEQCDIYQLFKDNISEIFSHPKDDILSQLVFLKDVDCYMLREKLLVECLDKLAANEIAVSDGTGIVVSGSSGMEIRRRYKINLVYEDIYIIGLSYTNSNPHKELGKLICAPSSKQRKSVATAQDPVETYADAAKAGGKAAPPNPPSKPEPEKVPLKSQQVKNAGKTNTNNATSPCVSAAVSQDVLTNLLSSVSEIKLALVGVRKENKELKDTLSLMCTKLDKQYKDYSLLKKEHEQLKSSVKDMKTAPSKSTANNRSTTENLMNVINAAANGFQSKNGKEAPDASVVRGATAATTNPPAPLPKTNTQNLLGHPNNGGARPRNGVGNRGNVPLAPIFGTKEAAPNKTITPIFGTKEAAPNKTIAGRRIVKNFTLFIGGVDLNVDEQGLGDHIVEEFNIEPIDIEINKTNRYNRSFKVEVKT